MIPIKKIGKIIEGEYRDWLIAIEPLYPKGEFDSNLVLFWKIDGTNGFDEYFETIKDAKEYVSEFNIEWTDEDYS